LAGIVKFKAMNLTIIRRRSTNLPLAIGEACADLLFYMEIADSGISEPECIEVLTDLRLRH
jgi:hypothetical protein